MGWCEWETQEVIELPLGWSVAVGYRDGDGWWSNVIDDEGKHIDGRVLGKSRVGVMVESLEMVRDALTDKREELDEGITAVEAAIKRASRNR